MTNFLDKLLGRDQSVQPTESRNERAQSVYSALQQLIKHAQESDSYDPDAEMIQVADEVFSALPAIVTQFTVGNTKYTRDGSNPLLSRPWSLENVQTQFQTIYGSDWPKSGE